MGPQLITEQAKNVPHGSLRALMRGIEFISKSLPAQLSPFAIFGHFRAI